MNHVLNECHAARMARTQSEYTRPRMLAQFRGTLEDDPDDDSLPERPTEAELDALEAKYRTETPAAVSEPLGLPVEAHGVDRYRVLVIAPAGAPQRQITISVRDIESGETDTNRASFRGPNR